MRPLRIGLVRILTGLAVLGLVVVGGLACRSENRPRGRAPLLVLAAASCTDVTEELLGRFTEKTGREVQLSVGPSNGLAQQVIAGAPADLFISAHPTWTDELEKKGLVAQVSQSLGNRLVLVVPRSRPLPVRKVDHLLLDEVRHVAIAGQNVPAGRYAEQALRELGLWDSLVESGRIVRGQDVRSTLHYVEQAAADAGIVYLTDARASDSVEIVERIPSDSHEPIRYPIALLRQAGNDPDAMALYDYLQSTEAGVLFALAGFEVLGDSSTDASTGSSPPPAERPPPDEAPLED